MRTHRAIGYGAVVLSFVFLPFGVFAQCGMPGMSHGGHESTHESAPKPKLSKQVRAVLENEERRAEMMAAVVEDPVLLQEMIQRVAATSKGRAVMREQLASAPADLGTPGDPAEKPETPGRVHQH